MCETKTNIPAFTSMLVHSKRLSHVLESPYFCIAVTHAGCVVNRRVRRMAVLGSFDLKLLFPLYCCTSRPLTPVTAGSVHGQMAVLLANTTYRPALQRLVDNGSMEGAQQEWSILEGLRLGDFHLARPEAAYDRLVVHTRLSLQSVLHLVGLIFENSLVIPLLAMLRCVSVSLQYK